MRCEHARELLSEAAYATPDAAELRAHVAECAACRALQADHAALDRVLALDEPAVARPGFDTRFFARLEQEKATLQRGRARRRFVWAALPLAAAAALALVLALRPPPLPGPAQPNARRPDVAPPAAPEIEPDDLSLAMDLELVEDIDVVERLDELEDYDVLSQVDADELERLAKEPN